MTTEDRDGITLGPRAIKWLLGTIGSLLVVIAAGIPVWDRVDSHWRLEYIQAQKDAEHAAYKAEVGKRMDALEARFDGDRRNAWLSSRIWENTATNDARWAELCRVLKRPNEICVKAEADAVRSRDEATEARRLAQQGRGK